MTEIVWLYNIAGERTAAIPNPSGLQLDERLQQSETLSFSVRADDPVANYIDDDRIVQYADGRYRITELDQGRSGAAVTWDVTADALWIDLLGFPATTTPLVGVTRAQGLDTILAGTGWTVGTVDGGGSFSMDVSLDETALGLVRAWAGVCAREVVFDTIAKTVSLLTEQGADRGLGFRYGRNLISVKRKIQPPQCTRLYAYGGSDLSISAVNPTGKPYVEDFSYYTDQGLSLPEAEAQYLKVQRWSDQRYLLATNLLDAATARLATLSRPLISYEATVADLSAIIGTGELFLMGDIVRVRDTPTGINVSARIVRKVTKPLEPDKTTVELGFLIDPLITQQQSNAASGTTAGDVSLLLDQNTSPYAVSSGQVQVNKISLGVDPLAGVANGVFGSEIDCTATGTGTVTVSFWLNATPVGPTVQVPFVAGPVHIGVPDFLAGLSESADFLVKMQVTSGTGALSVPVNGAHLYIFATGLASGGVDTNPEVIIAEGVVYTAPVVASGDELVSTGLYTPLSASPTETVVTTPTGVADGGVLLTNMLCRGVATGSTTAGTSVNVTIPSAAVIGDQMRLVVVTPSTATHTTPSGWALERSDTGAGTNALRTSVFRRPTGSGDPGATQTFAVSTSTNIVAAIYVLGGTTTTPENADGANGSSSDGTTVTAPSVTTTVDGCWILRIVACLAASASADTIITAPVGRAAIAHPSGLSVAISDEQAQATAGATGTSAASLGAAASWTAMTIALAP